MVILKFFFEKMKKSYHIVYQSLNTDFISQCVPLLFVNSSGSLEHSTIFLLLIYISSYTIQFNVTRTKDIRLLYHYWILLITFIHLYRVNIIDINISSLFSVRIIGRKNATDNKGPETIFSFTIHDSGIFSLHMQCPVLQCLFRTGGLKSLVNVCILNKT